jgi:hypothetical protein
MEMVVETNEEDRRLIPCVMNYGEAFYLTST